MYDNWFILSREKCDVIQHLQLLSDNQGIDKIRIRRSTALYLPAMVSSHREAPPKVVRRWRILRNIETQNFTAEAAERGFLFFKLLHS